MKNLHNFVFEKLVLNKSSKIQKTIKLDPISGPVLRYFNTVLDPRYFSVHNAKMKNYMTKGSKPERLISSIKDTSKLVNRWYAAVKLQWDDAIIKFGEEIEKRTDITVENLHQYIYLLYFKSSSKSSLENYEHYLDLYSINYNEKDN